MEDEHWKDFIEQVEDHVDSDIDFILEQINKYASVHASLYPDIELTESKFREIIKAQIKKHAMDTFNADIKDLYVTMLEDCIFDEL